MSTPKFNPSDQFMEMAAAAVQLRQLFDSYVSAGFSETQAMQLLIALLSGATGAKR